MRSTNTRRFSPLLWAGLLTLGFFLGAWMLAQPHRGGSTTLPSEAPVSSYDIDLKECASDLSGLHLHGQVNRGGTRVHYQLEGTVCSECIGLRDQPFRPENVGHLDKLCASLPEKTLENIRAARELGPQIQDIKKALAIRAEDTHCRTESDSNKPTCQADELKKRADLCEQIPNEGDAAAQYRQCVAKVEKHFQLFLAKSLLRDLSRNEDSHDNVTRLAQAARLRDDLITNLPSSYDQGIRDTLVRMSAMGQLNQARAREETLQAQGSSAAQARSATQSWLRRDSDVSDRTTSAFDLYDSLSQYGATRMGADPLAMQLLFQQNYQMPLQNYLQPGLSSGWGLSAQPTGLVPGTMVDAQGRMLAPGLQAPGAVTQTAPFVSSTVNGYPNAAAAVSGRSRIGNGRAQPPQIILQNSDPIPDPNLFIDESQVRGVPGVLIKPAPSSGPLILSI